MLDEDTQRLVDELRAEITGQLETLATEAASRPSATAPSPSLTQQLERVLALSLAYDVLIEGEGVAE